MKKIKIDIKTLSEKIGRLPVITEINITSFCNKINYHARVKPRLDGHICPSMMLLHTDNLKEIFDQEMDLEVALDDIAYLFQENRITEVWVNYPSITCGILSEWYNHFGYEKPWKYYHERDINTINQLMGDSHDAIAKCKEAIRLARRRKTIKSKLKK